jgi:hypothetical protein
MERVSTGKTTTELIRYAERTVGAALELELRDYLALAERVVNVSGDLIEHIQTAPGEMRAIHVCAVLLARLVTDLRAVSLLLRDGYAAPALSLIAGMFEMAYTVMYIGANEERADKWAKHDKPRSASPWKLPDMIRAVAEEMQAGEETIRREHRQIYRDVNMAKHGNPMALADVGIVQGEADDVYILAGPHLSDPVRRWAHTAISYAIRYAKLAALKFGRDHIPESPWRDKAFTEFGSMSTELLRLQTADIAEFGKSTGSGAGEDVVST